MKNTKIKTWVLSFFALMLVTGFTGCKKDDDNVDGPSKTSHKVVFKMVASAGSSISTVVYGYDSQITSATTLSGTTWTSPEITVPAGTVSLNVTGNARGVDASSSLKAQIYVDGELKKEGSSTGAVLSALASYSL
ncbi:hypothetical protein [Pedobacter sp. BMA]|uniref:hypothetical protein n=1 Tax=Pedobacter sp. BMA TaxID=1663685 RepID=UPI00064AF81D|nr:hypothetical protein [Pedobacter sp. BMA]KLT65322.1 hypothetical protein AB669_15640 [Pedobacter sp. BMA]